MSLGLGTLFAASYSDWNIRGVPRALSEEFPEKNYRMLDWYWNYLCFNMKIRDRTLIIKVTRVLVTVYLCTYLVRYMEVVVFFQPFECILPYSTTTP